MHLLVYLNGQHSGTSHLIFILRKYVHILYTDKNNIGITLIGKKCDNNNERSVLTEEAR